LKIFTNTTLALILIFIAPISGIVRADSGEITGLRFGIRTIDPPEKEFFTKVLDFHGIPIKAPGVVADEALYAASDRLALLLRHLPMVVSKVERKRKY
jgi:hypothetical protein